MDNSTLYAMLKSIQPESLTENAWASRAKVNRSWFNDVRNGATPRTDTLEKVVAAAGLTLAQFYELDHSTKQSAKLRAPTSSTNKDLPFRRPQEPLDIPLLGTAQGSDMEVREDGAVVFVERMDLDASNVVEYLRRPEALIGRDDIYAISVIGDSMTPKFESGDPAYVSSKQRARNGDYVVVQLKRVESDGEERLHIALLKRLVKRSSSYIELCQTEPEATFTIPLKEIHAIHRVIPWKEIVLF